MRPNGLASSVTAALIVLGGCAGGGDATEVATAVDEPAVASYTLAGSQGWGIDPYYAHRGMWGKHIVPDMEATSALRYRPATFPADTEFTWDVTPDPAWEGVSGYLHLAYGNYDWSPGRIPPRQVNDITELTLDVEWTYSGYDGSGLLAECWLSPVATPEGEVPRQYEVGFFPKLSPGAVSFVKDLPAVGSGSFADADGVLWNVVVGESGSNPPEPYFIAYRPGYVEHQGKLRFKDFFDFLKASGRISGNEWHNGVAFGVEPHHGAGSLTIHKFAATYTGSQ